ncbi:hypothetical protein HY480_01650 [Candidatus Uhrbacteria bacterium]|nr:hypothetical protein [Candidatus Uhrbacteria bacterium]
MSLSSWFSLIPPALGLASARLWGAIGLLSVIAAVVVRRMARRRQGPEFLKQPWVRAARLLTTSGVFLWLLLFFRYERIPFFGARFWLLFLIIGDLVWIAAILRHYFIRIPAQRKSWEADREKRKYLR